MAMHQLLGDATFHAASGEIRRGDTVVRLEPQPARVLDLLIRRAGELVTYDEICRAVWRDETHVNFQDGVHYCVRQIRRALDDQARAPRFIVTVPKRGYRFDAAAVRPTAGAGLTTAIGQIPIEPPVMVSVAARTGGWGRRFGLIGLAVGSILALVIVERQPNNHHETAVAVLHALHDFIY